MAYINQDEKKVIATALKVALKDYPTVKVSLSIQDNCAITATITQGPASLAPFDHEGKPTTDKTVNLYSIDKEYKFEAAKILNIINDCLHIGHYNNSNSQTDYFDCAWYINIKIGRWNKDFIVL